VLPSPFDPRRYVALIGAQQVRDLSLGGDTLAVHGWYDYWIASMENGRPTPLDVGHFDVAWRHLVSARPGDEGVTTNPALDLAQSTRAIVEDDR